MLSPIGNSYGYYTSSPYATGHTAASARTALLNGNHAVDSEVQAITEVPEVYSNEETERVQRTPSELATDRRTAYEVMTALTPRNAEQLNAPLNFMTKKPYEADFASDAKPAASVKNTTAEYQKALSGYGLQTSYTTGFQRYTSFQNAYSAYVLHNNGFYALA